MSEKSSLLPGPPPRRVSRSHRLPLLLVISALSLLLYRNARPSEDARFEAIYEAEYTWRKSLKVQWPDVTPKAQKKQLERWSDVIHQLSGLKERRLSPQNQDNFVVYKNQVEGLLAAQRFRDYEMPVNSDTAFWNFYDDSPKLSSEQAARERLADLARIPAHFDQQIANMRHGLKRGFTAPRVTLEGREKSVQSIIESRPYLKAFTSLPDSIPSDVRDALLRNATDLVDTEINPAHQRLLDFLVEDYIPNARTTLAAHSLPDGVAYYQSKIKEFTTLDLSPEDIHRIGLDEVAKIHKRMLAISEPHGNFSSFLHFLRTDPQFYAKAADELLKEAAWIAKQFDGVSEQWFGRLPRQRFAIVPVPLDIAPYWTSGRGGAGVYFVNTYDLPSRPLYSLRALTLHESAPGHSWQGSLSAENTNIPDFRRDGYISAYGEGWALYCETLGVEMGLYETEYDVFGMLSYQMWRAVRLVVDTGVHAMGWGREQAQQFLSDNTALSKHEIETEVDRYISWPGQALSYYLGQLAILRERTRAEKALDDDFDIRRFHDTVLEIGSVPLELLSRRIQRFIDDGGRGPY